MFRKELLGSAAPSVMPLDPGANAGTKNHLAKRCRQRGERTELAPAEAFLGRSLACRLGNDRAHGRCRAQQLLE